MMKRLSLIVGLVLCLSLNAQAQEGGTRSPFQFGFGARELAMGGANTAQGDAVTAPFWNASRLARAEYTQFSLFHSRLYDDDVAYQYLGVAVPTLDLGTFGLGVARLGVGGIERRDAGNVLLGETSDDRLGLFLAYGRQLAGYDVGVTLTMEHHQLDGYSATSSPGIDLNVTRRFALTHGMLRAVSVTLGGTNLVQPTMDLATETVVLPTHVAGGLTMNIDPVPGHELLLAARVDKSNERESEVSVGVEYDIAGAMQIRGGMRDNHASAGVGLAYRALSFDYGVVGRDLGTLHVLTLTTSLGRPTSERRRLRDEHREQQFNQLMSERLLARNSELIERLVASADSAMERGAYRDAGQAYDRALFMTRSEDGDTTDIVMKLHHARQAAETADRADRYARLVDSAETAFNRKDFLAARYYADEALANQPNGTEADAWRTRADEALRQRTDRSDLTQRQLEIIDSLVNNGMTDAAIVAIRALQDFAPNDPAIERASKRVHFEHYRARANMARAAGRLNQAAAMLDSARTYYPNHQWCIEFADLLQKGRTPQARPAPPVAVAKPAPISEDILREAKTEYADGQEAFRAGDLATAVARWESVERLAPDYESVRAYLVKAYRLVGIDYYGRNQLEDALETWRRAHELDPQNAEINAFITRTEAELQRIKEYSYDDR